MNAQTILFIYLLVIALDFIWERLLTVLNMSTIRANRDHIPGALVASLDPQSYQRSVAYSLTRSWFGLVSSTVTAALLLVFILTGRPWYPLPGSLFCRCRRIVDNETVQNTLFG